jgi:hypothetical protein
MVHGELRTAHGAGCGVCAARYTANGEWQMANGKWKMVIGSARALSAGPQGADHATLAIGVQAN